MPYPPEGSSVRQTFDLLKLAERKDRDDRTVFLVPAGETEGLWFCERHRRALGVGRFASAH
jgi:hypothetical protein